MDKDKVGSSFLRYSVVNY